MQVFSPYVWRVRLALYHKQIPYQSMCWRYADKEKIKPFEKVHKQNRKLLLLSWCTCLCMWMLLGKLWCHAW